jgi:hypothetical protein
VQLAAGVDPAVERVVFVVSADEELAERTEAQIVELDALAGA